MKHTNYYDIRNSIIRLKLVIYYMAEMYRKKVHYRDTKNPKLLEDQFAYVAEAYVQHIQQESGNDRRTDANTQWRFLK